MSLKQISNQFIVYSKMVIDSKLFEFCRKKCIHSLEANRKSLRRVLADLMSLQTGFEVVIELLFAVRSTMRTFFNVCNQLPVQGLSMHSTISFNVCNQLPVQGLSMHSTIS